MARHWLGWSALGFTVLLGITIWVLGREKEPNSGTFFALKRQVPDTLVVTHGGETTVLVPGPDRSWQIIHPITAPADAVVVAGMLRRLADLQVSRRFPLTPEKMDTYGMRHPRAIVRAAYADGMAPDVLTVGAFTINGVFDYVRAGEEEEVGLLESRISQTYLLKTSFHFRDTRLLSFEPEQVRSVSLVAAGRIRVQLENEAGSWRVVEPYPGIADDKKTLEYLTSLAHMHIREFVREDLGQRDGVGLKTPRAAIRIQTLDGEELVLDLGDSIPERDEVYASTRHRPELLAISSKYVPVLGVSADQFRQALPVTFGLEAVDSVRVRVRGGERVVHLRDPDSASGVRPYLRDWISLTALGFEEAIPPALGARGLGPPQGDLAWWGGGTLLAVVDVGVAAGARRAIRVSGGSRARTGEILLVEESLVGPLWRFLASWARGRESG